MLQLLALLATVQQAQAIEQLVPAIEGHFKRYQEAAHVPGLVYGIVKDGKLVRVGSMGVQDLEARRPVDADSRFRIASMSKVFTALAILKLRDEGKLSLDAPAETYVPELIGWTYPTDDSPRIRVRDLLSHTAGFVTDDPWGDRQQVLPEAAFTEMLKNGVTFTRVPATAFEYSNLGFALLGRIITNTSGRPYKDYIEQTIMRPLGMTATGYDYTEAPAEKRALGYRWENDAYAREPDMIHGTFGAMGGVQTTANDYAKWIAFLASAWPPRDGPETGPVKRATVRELSQGLNFPRRSNRPGTSTPACAQGSAYGMGLGVARDCDLGLALSHGGGYPGYGSFMIVFPDYNIGVFAFANRTYAGPAGALWDAAMELHKGGWFTPRTIPVSASLAEAYRAAGEIYSAGSVTAARAVLAVNFLMDRSEQTWAAELTRLNGEAGACKTDAPITATGAQSGHFRWSCEKTDLTGNLLLAPTKATAIQALQFRVTPKH
jgi:CubicO group peptidase (beta-lactamase class C family)